MRICALALGTRGDVQPFLAVAQTLVRMWDDEGDDKSEIVVCAADCFEGLVEKYCSCGKAGKECHRVSFASCGLETIEQPPGWMEANSLSAFIAENAKMYAKKYQDMASAMLRACDACDVILVNVFSQHIGMDIAEHSGAKCVAMKLTPDTSSWEVPPFGETPWSWPLNAGIFISARYIWRTLAAVKASISSKYTDEQNRFRKESLDLDSVSLSRFREMREMTTVYGFSAALHPRPSDWPANVHVTGFWFADAPHSGASALRQANSGLATFVENCRKTDKVGPVCVTFGSMSVLDANGSDLVGKCIDAVVGRLSKKCVLIRGWSNRDVVDRAKCKYGDALFVVDAIPHELLFPLCSCVLFHGGAGTTARALACGTPCVVVPILRWYDQLGWGQCIEHAGVGMHLGSVDGASVEALATSVKKVCGDPTIRARAQYVSAEMKREGGVDEAIRIMLAACR